MCCFRRQCSISYWTCKRSDKKVESRELQSSLDTLTDMGYGLQLKHSHCAVCDGDFYRLERKPGRKLAVRRSQSFNPQDTATGRHRADMSATRRRRTLESGCRGGKGGVFPGTARSGSVPYDSSVLNKDAFSCTLTQAADCSADSPPEHRCGKTNVAVVVGTLLRCMGDMFDRMKSNKARPIQRSSSHQQPSPVLTPPVCDTGPFVYR